jgi:hypothetical protein
MHSEAGAIVAHYLRQLTARAGLQWTEANERDMRRLGTLLGQDTPTNTIPPYRDDERQTLVLERDPAAGDANYQEWRRRQYEGDADAAAVRRMTQNGSKR